MPSRRAPTASANPDAVTVVLVAGAGNDRLRDCLRALAAQTRRPARLLGVDVSPAAGSADRPRGFGRAAVVPAPRAGFTAAVAAGLAAEPDADSDAGWLWLLTADCVPAADALDQLMAVGADPAVAMVGPKITSADGRLLDLGRTVDQLGRVHRGVDPDEVDQGQRDGRHDVVGLGAGMLVRREVWERLGGFDPALPLDYAEADLGWRARRAGYRVLVDSAAVVRRADPEPAVAGPAATRAGALLLLANLPAPAAALSGLLLVLAGLARAVGHLLALRPGLAAREVTGALGLVLRPAAWAGLRGRPPGSWPRVRLARPAAAPRFARRPGRRPGARRARPTLARPGGTLLAAVLIASLVAERHLLHGALAGGRLLPAPAGAADLWHFYASSWHQVGAGTGAAAPPYLAVLAGLSAVLAGKPWVAVDVLLLGAPVLAALAMWFAARRTGAGWRTRWWAAAAYGLSPVATGAVAGGRLDAAVALIAAPLLAVAAADLVRPTRVDDPWRAAVRFALVLALAAAFGPLLYPLAVVLLLAAALAGRVPTRRLGPLALAVALPVALLWPWPLTVLAHPALLGAGVGRQLATVRGALPAALVGDPAGPGTPPGWLFLPVVVAALLGLVHRPDRGWVRAGWATASFGAVAVVVLGQVSVAPLAGGPTARPWLGAPVAVLLTGLLLAAAAGTAGLPAVLSRRAFGPAQVAVAAIALLAVPVPAAALGAWLAGGTRWPLHTGRAGPLPSFAAAELAADGGRALLLGADRSRPVRYTLTGAAGPSLGAADLPTPPAARRLLDQTTRTLLAGGALGDPVDGLRQLGVRFVAGLSRAVPAGGLAGLPALQQVPGVAGGLWQLSPAGAAAAVLDPGRESPRWLLPVATHADRVIVPAGAALLVLADPADPGWQAWRHGRRLRRVTVFGWAQGFRLTGPAGPVTVVHRDPLRTVDLWVVAGLLLVAVGLAVRPARRPEVGR
jgi:hypothetical protein